MVAVAVLSLAVPGARMLAFRRSYLSRAAYHEAAAVGLIQGEIPWARYGGRRPGSSPRAWLTEAVKYHEAMRDKWKHAARYPFLPVALDPPEPE